MFAKPTIKLMHLTLVVVVWLLGCAVGPSYATTYYIDYQNGSDIKSGTTKEAPWKHHPFMRGFAGRYVHQAGDRFIFKGGITWPSTTLPLSTKAGGTGNAVDYYGVDASWYSGSQFSRPVFDGGYVDLYDAFTSREKMPRGCRRAGLWCISEPYVIIDNVELRNLMCHFANGPGLINITTGAAGIVLVENSYLHGWTVLESIHNDSAHGGIIAMGSKATVQVQNNDISNVEYSHTRNNGILIYGARLITGNKLHDAPNAINGGGEIEDNEFYNIDFPVRAFDRYDPQSTSHVHTNVIWSNGGGTRIHHNLFHQVNPPEIIFLHPAWAQPPGAYTDLVYDNVVLGENELQFIPIQPDTDTCDDVEKICRALIYNNTVEVSGKTCMVRPVGRPGRALRDLIVQNNHFVTGSSSPICYNQPGKCGMVSGTTRITNNLVQSYARATAAGYNYAQRFMPSSAEAPTVRRGLNLSDVFNTDFNKVQRPQGQGASWDIGAYQFVEDVLPSKVKTAVQ